MNKPIEISTWSDAARSSAAAAAERHGERNIAPAILGVFGTLLIHGWAALAVVSATSASRDKVPEPHSSDDPNDERFALVLMGLPLDPTTMPGQRRVTVATPSLSARSLESTLKGDIEIDAPSEIEAPADEQKTDQQVTAGAVADDKSRLASIYSSQIHARIERIWRRPRTRIDPEHAAAEQVFQCRVSINQDTVGNVKEILLPRCNGSNAWQQSLVLAVREASPLPAPPDASVYEHWITLDFVGFGFRETADASEYESALATSATGASVR